MEVKRIAGPSGNNICQALTNLAIGGHVAALVKSQIKCWLDTS